MPVAENEPLKELLTEVGGPERQRLWPLFHQEVEYLAGSMSTGVRVGELGQSR